MAKRESTSAEKAIQRFADVSSDPRLIAATRQAYEAHARVRRFANRLCEELDDVTSPHGIPVTELDPGDSMVVAVEHAIQATTPKRKTDLGMRPLSKPKGT